MNAARLALAALGITAASGVLAADEAGSGRRAAPVEKPGWEFAITAYPTAIRGGDNYTSAIAVADRGQLHLEARINYESIGARSAFVGWTFSGGNDFKWELTPLIGGTWGPAESVVPGLEASLAWKRLDFYIEAEYVHDRSQNSGSYLYAWSELGFKPLEWLRLGLVTQRTRAYGGDRDIQRGPFVQVTWKRLTVGAFWFNPGSNEQVFIASVGVSF